MVIEAFDTPSAYLAELTRELGAREREHHLILGAAHGLRTPSPAGTYMGMVRDERGLALAALSTAKRPLVLATDREDASAALDGLAAHLVASGIAPSRFVADVGHAEIFAHAWRGASGVEPRVLMRQRLHALTDVADLPRAPGELRAASASDVELLARWQREFDAEALGGEPAAELIDPEMRSAMAERVRAGELYLWIDEGEPRGMAASARPTARGIAINSVYTPRRWRGRGYATTAVADLSRRLLAAGRAFCVLYTDLANPTSNAIYARIGYRPVSDSLFCDLTPHAP